MDKIKDYIKLKEGLRLRPYRDTLGIWTIGWGHNLEANNEPMPEIITIQDANAYFEADFINAMRGAQETLTGFGFLNEARRAVIVSMIFQLGLRGFRNFKKTIALINEGNYIKAAHEMLDSNAFKQTPARWAEQAIMFATGTWPEGA